MSLFKHMAALLASTMSTAVGRIYGSEAIERHIDRHGGSAGYRQRSRWPADKPKRKHNMRHVGKRVRRKHRRAA